MAVLSNADRLMQWTEFMQVESEGRISCGITKADLRAAFDDADDWADANAGSFNTAIRQPARSALTARQKARLLMLVIAKRFEVTL